MSVFASYSYTNAKHDNLKVVTKVGNDLVESNLKDKKVENAPTNIIRTGITYSLKGFSVTGQLSFVGESFSDANNTVAPTANGQTSLIPSYKAADVKVVYKWNKNYNVNAGANNLANEKYFTRSGGGYPGPGLLPSDGRSFSVSFGAIF